MGAIRILDDITVQPQNLLLDLIDNPRALRRTNRRGTLPSSVLTLGRDLNA